MEQRYTQKRGQIWQFYYSRFGVKCVNAEVHKLLQKLQQMKNEMLSDRVKETMKKTRNFHDAKEMRKKTYCNEERTSKWQFSV